MMRKRLFCGLLAALMLAGCTAPNPPSTTTTTTQGGEIPMKKENLAIGCVYSYDYGVTVTGDDPLKLLTDGKNDTFVSLVTGKDKIDLDFNDWYNNTHTVAMDNSYIVLTVDLGFVTHVTKAGLVMEGYSKSPIEIFASNDGYNFTQYVGKFHTFEGENFGAAVNFDAKAIQFLIPAAATETVKIAEIVVEGSRQHQSVSVLTSQDSMDVRNETDPITKRAGEVIYLELQEIRNVSEVVMDCDKQDLRIDVRYSVDGENWTDFGQSFLYAQGEKSRYLVTRNHTVAAKHIAIFTYADELEGFSVRLNGCETAVAEPDYDYLRKAEQLSNSNVAAYCPATLSGVPTEALTDMIFTASTNAYGGSVVVKLPKTYDSLCAVAINTLDDNMADTVIKVDGKEIAARAYVAAAPGSATRFFFFDEKVSGSEVEFVIKASLAEIFEVMVYDRQPALPMARGGFFQLPTSGGNNPAAQNSDYTWYLQLKGMRDLGMEYVIIQYSSHFLAKTTLIDGENIKAQGFTYNATYGSQDVCKAVLDAAEKLGMQVYLGTVHDSDFNKPLEYMPTYGPIVEAGKAMITDIEALYGDHPAFAGYYLSDETCDHWLNLEGGVEAARFVYKGQSDYIRQIDPDAKIMIAPAIWRSGEPAVGAEHLYEMIKPENEGDKPIVDILAAQDCLGREQTLTVTDQAYASFERYVELWAKATRKAGVEFWHDAEVFEVTYSAKRCSEVINSFHIEAKTSGTIIVFDIPHYFSTYSMGSSQDARNCIKTRIMRDYVRFYHGVKEYDKIQ